MRPFVGHPSTRHSSRKFFPKSSYYVPMVFPCHCSPWRLPYTPKLMDAVHIEQFRMTSAFSDASKKEFPPQYSVFQLLKYKQFFRLCCPLITKGAKFQSRPNEYASPSRKRCEGSPFQESFASPKPVRLYGCRCSIFSVSSFLRSKIRNLFQKVLWSFSSGVL